MVAAIPHHHHDGIACVLADIAEHGHHHNHCDQENANSNHHDTPKENCVVHGYYVASHNNLQNQADIPSCELLRHFSLQALPASAIIISTTSTSEESLADKHSIPLIEPAWLSVFGLRAPPSL